MNSDLKKILSCMLGRDVYTPSHESCADLEHYSLSMFCIERGQFAIARRVVSESEARCVAYRIMGADVDDFKYIIEVLSARGGELTFVLTPIGLLIEFGLNTLAIKYRDGVRPVVEHKPIRAVVATAKNHVEGKGYPIGRGNTMPWVCRDDLEHFKNVTLNSVVITGSKTFKSYGARPLPKRLNIVVTRDPMELMVKYADVISETNSLHFVHSKEEALVAARYAQDLLRYAHTMVIGGGEIYKMFEDETTCVIRTTIDAEIEDADTFWSPIVFENQHTTPLFEQQANERNSHSFKVETVYNAAGKANRS